MANRECNQMLSYTKFLFIQAKSIEWRRANRIDEIVDQWEPPMVLVKYYPMGIIGCDKFSCPGNNKN
ncbi:hypothetical protein DAPPUDRAFT_237987 [Daphnia pulex]|uniref:Uncharacterized protein n=1 Tax=Daphnia pulex TaxID=6669 RepID=E9G4X5_DAPPU|nr:hypothetical protein DAPPUDRAFT_237987 [Daphnia pulex]|eukprot:EFX85377.1 hypothetical protein DAPPUDRAFT_237987 [Daphnia pulex]